MRYESSAPDPEFRPPQETEGSFEYKIPVGAWVTFAKGQGGMYALGVGPGPFEVIGHGVPEGYAAPKVPNILIDFGDGEGVPHPESGFIEVSEHDILRPAS